MFSPLSVCLLIGLFACNQDDRKTTEWISMKLGGSMKEGVWVREEPITFKDSDQGQSQEYYFFSFNIARFFYI